jgi:hypothetical protein
MGPVLFCLASLSGALVARGSAYSGRFSIHIVGITCGLAVCAVAKLRTLVDSNSVIGHAFRHERRA